jgi:23S rRNA (adenine-N6)-dimethyltransferase
VSAAKRTPRDERRRRLGQNFLQADVAKTVVAGASFQPSDLVVEIGAGLGSLTFPLAQLVSQVLAVEIDPILASRLRREIQSRDITNVSVVCCDARRYRLPRRPFRAFGSLPFGATTALMRHLLDDPGSQLERADLVVQWEVARKRATAPPSSLMSAAWAPWWVFELGRRISAEAFRPLPAVDAAVLRVRRREPAVLPIVLAGPFGEFLRDHWGVPDPWRTH